MKQEKFYFLFFSIYKFECFTTYLFGKPFIFEYQSLDIERASYKNPTLENLDLMNNPQKGVSINFARSFMITLSFLALLTVVNILSGWLGSNDVWKYGLFFSSIPAMVLGVILAPDNPKKYLKEFRRIDKLEKKERWKIHIFSLSIVILVVVCFVLSSVFYMKQT